MQGGCHDCQTGAAPAQTLWLGATLPKMDHYRVFTGAYHETRGTHPNPTGRLSAATLEPRARPADFMQSLWRVSARSPLAHVHSVLKAPGDLVCRQPLNIARVSRVAASSCCTIVPQCNVMSGCLRSRTAGAVWTNFWPVWPSPTLRSCRVCRLDICPQSILWHAAQPARQKRAHLARWTAPDLAPSPSRTCHGCGCCTKVHGPRDLLECPLVVIGVRASSCACRGSSSTRYSPHCGAAYRARVALCAELAGCC